MPLPSKADVGRTAFIVVWFVLAVATLSWKAPWFWNRTPAAAQSSPTTSPVADAREPAGAIPRGDTVRYAAPPERARASSPASASVAPVPVSLATDGQLPVAGAGETLDAARARHEARVREHPADPESLRGLARIYEASGQFEAALDLYRRLESVPGSITAEDQLHVARLLRWTGQPAAAVPAYERYRALAGSDAIPDANGELGVALADAGRYADALRVLDDAIAATPAEPSLYVALARAADAIGQPQRAADALVGLSALRTLSPDEAMWLTGQLEETGRIEPGLPALRAALAAAPDNAPLWERLGDLEWTRQEYAEALAAYERLPDDCAHRETLKKRARAAARAGRIELAARRYQQAADCAPGDAALALERARFHGSNEQFDTAVIVYERYASLATPAPDIALEMAQTALAAERPDLALAWADAANARGERSASLDYARAQALHLLNRPAEASGVLAEVSRARPGDGAVLAWQGRAALAQGRHLAAFRLFDAAIARGAGGRADLFAARGDAAAARGDVARARSSYEIARRSAQNPESLDLDVRELELRRRTTPELRVPAEFIRDSNDLSIVQGGTEVALWVASALRLETGAFAGRVEQAGSGFPRRAFSVRASEILPMPSIRLELGAGVEDYGAVTLPIWLARLRHDFESGGYMALETMRQTPWSTDARLGTPRYNRISDLQALGASFHATGLRGVAELPVGARQSVRLDGGWRRYSDSNQQSDMYVHVQRELATREDGSLWVALQPQVYVERWTRPEPAYYSPDHHVTAGVGVRAQATKTRWSLDGTFAPQLVSSDGATAFGLFASGNVRRKLGLIWVGGEAAIFEDRRSSYRLHRFAGEVRIPIGR